jgi:transcriptional regulator with XRE-family HTH domain
MNDISSNEWYAMTDQALSKTIGHYIKRERVSQNKSQSQVAEEAGVSRSTLSLLERGENVSISNFIQILRTLQLLHVMEVFKPFDEISPIAYAKMKMKGRKRARKLNLPDNIVSDIGW